MSFWSPKTKLETLLNCSRSVRPERASGPVAPRRAVRAEAPAFTRREVHLPPTHRAAPSARKPPRSRGGRFTFHRRSAPRRPCGGPRVYAAGGSRSPYARHRAGRVSAEASVRAGAE